MEIKFSDIVLAFEFVGSEPEMSNIAVLCKETGEIFYASDFTGEDEIPEEVYDRDDCIGIPHKNELKLGRNLVFEFVEQYLPNDLERVWQIFRNKGAYRRYKDLLDDRGLLQMWYEYEDNRKTEKLRNWCEENEIAVIG